MRRSLGFLFALIVFLAIAPARAEENGIPTGWRGKEGPLDYTACIKLATASETAEQSPDAAIEKLCKAIVRAWKKHSPEEFDPGLNVLKVSFGHNASCQNTDAHGIDADAVARLLSHPNLLPPHYSGGLALHNVKLEGALVLYNATVEIPVNFTKATFCGGKINRRVLELSELDQAIYFSGVHFKKRLLISDARLNGHLSIIDSHFENSVGLLNVNQRGTSKSELSLEIITSKIDGRLLILGGSFADNVNILANTIGKLILSHDRKSPDDNGQPHAPAKFIGSVKISDNDIGNAWILDVVLSGDTSISSNRVQGALRFNGPKLKYPDNTETVDAEIAGNQIGGNFVIRIAAAKGVHEINLESNIVKGDTDISLPSNSETKPPIPWKGELNLTNFQGSARLSIQYDGIPGYYKKLDKIFPWVPLCPPIGQKKNLQVNLNGADLHLLKWNLPFECEYRWEGVDLKYERWEGPAASAGSIDIRSETTDLEKLTSWRHLMSEQNLAGLNFIADYLAAKGSLSRSRKVRREAKELNYRPTFKISAFPSITGALSSLDKFFSVLRDFFSYSLDFLLNFPSLLFACFVYVLLAPTGWGANPEWALVLLIVGWLVGTAGYKRYSNNIIPALWARSWWPSKSLTPGFMQYDQKLEPKRFKISLYSLDAMLPLINLHHYDLYYPRSNIVRGWTVIQHVLGWWWLTAFIAAAAIL